MTLYWNGDAPCSRWQRPQCLLLQTRTFASDEVSSSVAKKKETNHTFCITNCCIPSPPSAARRGFSGTCGGFERVRRLLEIPHVDRAEGGGHSYPMTKMPNSYFLVRRFVCADDLKNDITGAWSKQWSKTQDGGYQGGLDLLKEGCDCSWREFLSWRKQRVPQMERFANQYAVYLAQSDDVKFLFCFNIGSCRFSRAFIGVRLFLTIPDFAALCS